MNISIDATPDIEWSFEMQQDMAQGVDENDLYITLRCGDSEFSFIPDWFCLNVKRDGLNREPHIEIEFDLYDTYIDHSSYKAEVVIHTPVEDYEIGNLWLTSIEVDGSVEEVVQINCEFAQYPAKINPVGLTA